MFSTLVRGFRNDNGLTETSCHHLHSQTSLKVRDYKKSVNEKMKVMKLIMHLPDKMTYTYVELSNVTFEDMASINLFEDPSLLVE